MLVFLATTTDPIAVTPDAPATATVELHAGGTVHGRVVDASGAVLARARIGRGDMGAFLRLTVDEQGRFQLPGVGEAGVKLRVAAPGFVERELQVPPGVDDVGDVVLEPQPASAAPTPSPAR